MSNHKEEEYTDYSCSTSLERLARDIETTLRAWNVDRGSDRHVSIAGTAAGTAATSVISSESIATGEGTANTGATSQGNPASGLIRNNSIAWIVTTKDSQGQRMSVTVDLELALWDSPDATKNRVSRTSYGDDDDTNAEERSAYFDEDEERDDDNGAEPLVKSLQRTPFGQMPWHNCLFDNFSTLFGIGQHISLTPIQPHPVSPILVEVFGQSILKRHDDEKTAPMVFGSILGGWLQGALNIAVSNCKCCIPAFGVWGLYRPNDLIVAASSDTNGNSSVPSSPRRSTRSTDGMSVASGSSGMMQHAQPGAEMEQMSVFPQWARALRQVTLPAVSRTNKNRLRPTSNKRFCPPLIAGTVISSSTISMPSTMGTFQCSATVGEQNISKNSRLTVWGNVLLKHCPKGEQAVILCGARHVFGWFKIQKPVKSASLFSNKIDEDALVAVQEWRHSPGDGVILQDADLMNIESEDVQQYQAVCRRVALSLLETAWKGKASHYLVPTWGPEDDPIKSVYATVTWNGKINDDGPIEPLMSFPLKIRSKNELSNHDLIEMEESVERTILNPLSPTNFSVQAFFDRDVSATPLTANQRCTVAALIRSATLPGETLIQHLIDEDLVDRWDNKAGTMVAMRLSERANVSSSTRQIVRAMDWTSTIDDMIELEDAEAIVHEVMSGYLNSNFPSSPEESFVDDDTLHSSFRKSAPWGRLLSVLFAHMARLRSISSIAMVWTVFVNELRRRWELRESIPNMRYISGLDPHPLTLYEMRCYSTIGHKANFSAFLHCVEPDPDDFHCLIGQKLQVFNIGVEFIVATEIAEHEAMEQFLGTGEIPGVEFQTPKTITTGIMGVDHPEVVASSDDGQENSKSSSSLSDDDDDGKDDSGANNEADSKPTPKWPKAKAHTADEDAKKNYGPPSIDTDLDFWVMDEPGHAANLDVGLDFVEPPTVSDDFDFAAPPPTNLDKLQLSSSNMLQSDTSPPAKLDNKFVVENLPNDDAAWEGTIMHGDGGSGGSHHSMATSASLSQMYYDAAEAGSIFSMKHEFVSLDAVVNMEDMLKRPGARCPVYGANVGRDSDQLYAPYLQRPIPLTDDVVLERKLMLARDFSPKKGKSGNGIQYRLELAQRLQKSKLLSDMKSFKAANPKAGFQDFANWYGNPGSPLDDYNDASVSVGMTLEVAKNESTAKKLDRANEAMKILNTTRDFWANCWNEANPIPAVEQDPLFDVTSTVEMALDYLDQMHPTNLLNQVVAVNLSSAYFAIASSAKDAMEVPAVQNCMKQLRKRIDKALALLSRDAAGGSTGLSLRANSLEKSSSSQRYSSDEAIAASDEACIALADTETIVSRAVSLLHKFPKEYELVQAFMSVPDGTSIVLTKEREKKLVLDGIRKGAAHLDHAGNAGGLPSPVLREYILRNLDEGSPCQLSVRFGDNISSPGSPNISEGGVLLAISKCYKD